MCRANAVRCDIHAQRASLQQLLRQRLGRGTACGVRALDEASRSPQVVEYSAKVGEVVFELDVILERPTSTR